MFLSDIVSRLAQVSGDVGSIPFFAYGESLRHPSKGTSDSRIKFNVHIDNGIKKIEGMQKVYEAFGLEFFSTKDSVYMSRVLPFNKRASLLLQIVDGRNVNVSVNDFYFKFFRFPISGISPVGIHLTNIVFGHLLSNNFLTIHCAAISKNGKSSLIFGPPSVGKTTTVFRLLDSDPGIKFVAEDIAVTDGKYVYSCPHTTTYLRNEIVIEKYLHNIGLSKKEVRNIRYNLRVQRIPFLHYLVNFPVDTTKVANSMHIEEISEIESIWILDRFESSNVSHTEYSEEYLHQKLVKLNSLEFAYTAEKVLQALAFSNDDYNLDRLRKRESEIFRKLIDNAKCKLLSTQDESWQDKLITEISRS